MFGYNYNLDSNIIKIRLYSRKKRQDCKERNVYSINIFVRKRETYLYIINYDIKFQEELKQNYERKQGQFINCQIQ